MIFFYFIKSKDINTNKTKKLMLYKDNLVKF
jgi:hypothetical protein